MAEYRVYFETVLTSKCAEVRLRDTMRHEIGSLFSFFQEWDEEFKEHELNLKAIKQKGQDLMNDQHPGTAAIAVHFPICFVLALFSFFFNLSGPLRTEKGVLHC